MRNIRESVSDRQVRYRFIRQHAQLIFNWANEDKARFTTEENKQCLRTLCCRMFKLIENLPVQELPTTHDEDGEEIVVNG